MAVLLKRSDLWSLGWTPTLVKALLSEPDEKEEIKKGVYHSWRHWYAQERVSAAMQCPAWVAARAAKERRQARPALRRQAFQRVYPTWRAAVPDACKGLHALNRLAKHRTCTEANKAEIYALKNTFVELLYTQGFCTAAWLHILTLPAKPCYSCGGTGDQGDCDRCGGSGNYLSEKRLRFYCFRFSVGRGYTWHQPDNLVTFPVTTTAAPANWSGVERDKPLGMPRSKLAAAKDLLRWVVAQAKGSAPEPEIAFHESIPPLGETEQMGLFS